MNRNEIKVILTTVLVVGIITAIVVVMVRFSPDELINRRLSELEPPVVVIVSGQLAGNCLVRVVDANGLVVSFSDPSACSLKAGDTLLPARPIKHRDYYLEEDILFPDPQSAP